MKTSRRQFLKNGAAALSASSVGTVLSSMSSFNALAQSNEDDYKAIVCIFLFGGMDCHDVVLPFDQASWDSYAQIRQSFLNVQGNTRTRSNLLPLNPVNANAFGNRQFALPPEMPNIKSLFDNGNAAIIGNVGPLIEPVSKSQFDQDGVRLPPRLFSHNDQQATWQASSPEGAQFGWGGLFADAALAANPNNAKEFTTITSSGNELFLTGRNAQPYQISTQGAASVNVLEWLREFEDSAQGQSLLNQVTGHFEAKSFTSNNLLQQDVATILANAYAANEKYNQTQLSAPTLSTQFPATPLGTQLRAVANTISTRTQLQVNRQVFLVGIGGFDTHSQQAQDLPQLLAQLDTGVAAFYQALQELNLTNQVTTFTASDFGRTLAVNGDGTDHGWGGHHFVVGGAVQGNHIYGTIPPASFNHEWDAGGGRLIPSVAVEQLAAPLGRWFGLNDAELNSALPNLVNFPDGGVAFI